MGGKETDKKIKFLKKLKNHQKDNYHNSFMHEKLKTYKNQLLFSKCTGNSD